MPKILAIDDKQDNLITLLAVLKNLIPGCAVITAQSGVEGILDIKMPGMDGFEVCKRLKSADKTKHIPVIMLTAARTDAKSRIKGLDLGADAFLGKPIDESELVAQVNVMLRIKRAEDILRKEKDLLEEVVQERTKAVRCALKDWEEIVEAIGQPTLILDPQHGVIAANRATVRAMGRSKEALMGMKCYEIMHHTDQPPEDCPMEKMMASGHFETVEMEVEAIGGVFLVSCTPLFDDDGNLQKVIHIATDITERKRAEDQIRRSKIMLQAVFDGISDPLVMVGKDMSVKMLNRAAAEYYQVELRNVIDNPCYQTFRGRSTPCEGCDIPSAVSSGEAATFERKGVADSDRFEQVVIYPLRKEKREEGAAIVRISDITEGKLMQRQVMQSEKLASLGLLVSGIAHEINNPNNFIIFNIPIMRDYLNEMIPILDDYARVHPDFELFGMSYPEFRKDIFKLLDNIEHGSGRINTIVSDLREFSRRKDKHERRLVDLKQVVEKSVAICRSEIRKKVKTFEMNIPEGFPKIFTDPEAVEQVLVNILINAAHAADKEDSWVRLNVRSGETPHDHLIIEVSDNGCGMDDKSMGKIFDPFFTTKPVGTGTGLGLYVSHSLIKGLGGRIEVESEEGEGSMFRVVVPEI